MTELTPNLRRSRQGWIVVAFFFALGLILAGLLISPELWAVIFQTDLTNPQFDAPERPSALQGGQLLRMMLLLSGCSYIIFLLVLSRFCAGCTTKSDQPKWGAREGWILFGLIVLGFTARLPRLAESLWYDEIAAWTDYGMRGPGWIVGTYYDPANHIAHTLLTWCAVECFGDDAFALRFPALLFSLGSIVAMYGLARHASGIRVATIAAALGAILPVAILEGVEARGYSMMIFFASLSTWLALSAWSRNRPWKWFAYALCCALGIWAHLMTVFVPLGHGLWFAWRMIKNKEIGLGICAFSGLLFAAILTLTLYAPVIPQILSIRETFAATDGNEPRIFGPEGFHTLLQLGGSWYWWSSVVGLGFLVCGFIRATKTKTIRAPAFLSMLGLPLMLIVVAIAGSWMYARFTLIALPGAILVIACGLDALWDRKRVLALFAGLLIFASSIGDLTVRPPKQPLREAATYLRNHVQPSEHVLVIGLAHRVMDMYRGELDFSYSLFHGRDLSDDLARTKPTWIILMYPNHVSTEKKTMLNSQGFTETQLFRGWVDWGNGDILIYQKNFFPPRY